MIAVAARSLWRALTLSLALVLITPLAGRAQPANLEAALNHLLEDSYSETIAAIDEIARSGTPNAAQVLEALAAERLYFSAERKVVLFQDASGAWFDALSNKPAAAIADLAPVRLNNRVRSAVQSALGGLEILSPAADKRRAAAAALLKSREPRALPTLATAIANERDAGIRGLMEETRAAIVLGNPDASIADQISAIGVLASRSDQDALSILKGLPANQSSEVKEATARAIQAVEGRLLLWEKAQDVWYGISLGSVLLLAAIGLAITFGVMGVINMAHGEMVMLGAYTAAVVQVFCAALAPNLVEYALIISLPIAFLVAAAVGLLIERLVIRYLYGRPLETLLATFGISLILQQAVRTAFGPTNKEVSTPAFMSGAFELGGLSITYGRMWIVAFALIVFVALQLVLRATPFGLHMRAVTQNRRMAGSMGIRTRRIDALAFAVGSGIAGIAGVALSQIDNVSPNLGQSYIVDSFLVVVFGGVGNLWGTLVGALSLGIANKFLEPVAGAVLGKIALLVLVILFIQWRPRGLFALKGRAAEV
jgi:urea transport system permease protein